MSHVRRHVRRVLLSVVLAAASGATMVAAQQQAPGNQWPTPDKPAWPSSPYHGVEDGNGRVIPCRCRFNGRLYELGEQVCLTVPGSSVLARCDLQQNNTTWVRTSASCTTSMAPDVLQEPTPAVPKLTHSAEAAATPRAGDGGVP